MPGVFGFFQSFLHIPFAIINHQVAVLCGLGGAAILAPCLIAAFVYFSPAKRRSLSLAAPSVQSAATEAQTELLQAGSVPGAGAPAFASQVAAAAQAKDVPAAPLNKVLGRLVSAGIPDAEISARLFAAADGLAALRASLSNWQSPAPNHEEVCAYVLECIDRGELDAAGEVLKQRREAHWLHPTEAAQEEAEFYAREAMIDHIQLRYADAAAKHACAAAILIESGGPQAARFLIAEAQELCADGREFGNRESILLALDACHRALALAPREQCPAGWAAAMHCLGKTLVLLGEECQEPERLEEAVKAYLAALEEWTRELAPAEWAKAQRDLGEALQALGGQEGGRDRLREAAEAYRAALAGWTREQAPREWAHTKKQLADSLAVLGIEERDSECLIEAVNAYREALDGLSRETAPLEWALMQNNLGNALQALSEIDPDSGRLHLAVAAYQAALQEVLLPSYGLAITNNNLGNAFVAIAECENGKAMLEEAAKAYRAALQAQPPEEAPLAAARTHMNLAYTLGALWNRTRRRNILDEALAAAEAALNLIKGREEEAEIPAGLAREAILAAIGGSAEGAPVP